MQNKKIGAVIVTYNPQSNLEKLLEKLKCLNEIIIIDNNSNDKTKIEQALMSYPEVKIIYNDTNEGLAKSYNKAESIFSQEVEWFFTFDQDSLPEESMVDIVSSFIEKNKKTDKIAIIVPEISDKNLSEIDGSKNKINYKDEYEFVKKAIQSGMCINRQSMINVGGFEDNLFMYYVDTDFVNKVLKHEYNIIKIKDAKLYHEDGKLEKKKFIINFYLNERSEVADYYRAKNLIYMVKKYGCRYLKDIFYDLFVKTIFSKNKKKFYKNTFRGLKDGIKQN